MPQEKTIIGAYKETYDEVRMVYYHTPPCSPHGDEGLESSFHYNIFGTKLYKDVYGEYEEDMYNQKYTNEDYPIFDKDVDDNYCSFMENPIYDMSRKGTVD